eukprot:jgi/Tetstr1/455916/TSEL_042697.t1
MAAVEAAEAQAEVAVVVMAVDAAMEAHPEADEDRAGTLDMEAMFSRILEKSQAAHGATGAMRLAVELQVVRNLWGLTVCRSLLYQDRVDARQCCPQDLSARNPELRMRQPGWDAQHEQLTKQRPQGFEPAFEQEAPASYEGRRGGGAITSDMLDIRNQQLLQHLRTALQHAKFPGLPVAVVSDMTPEHAARWLEARNTALRGGLDTRDHMAVAWETVLRQAVRRFEATARLTWVDYTHLDLTRVFAAAVQSVYGLSLPRVSVPPLSSPPAEPQANIHPVDVVRHGVKPMESRRQLSATSSELQQLREVQRSAYPDYPEYDRHSAFYVDFKLTVIVIGGVRILMALLDTGCDYSGVHRRVVDRMKPGEADATLQSMSMQGIGGKMEMQRLVGRISYVINPDTDWERKFEWPSRIELQSDNVGTDAAVQPEQQDDDAELPELVADSDDEEDFVPCWVEEVPDHVANVIASCFTLRASPMDADFDSDEELPGLVEDSSDNDDVYEELPDLMEDSSDDDDVYLELTIMTHTEPEEPDCPSDDVELEDGTAMPLKEHEDEIPDRRELRRQRQAAGRLHLSGHTLERLALVRAVPHSTPELTYIIDLDRTGGKEGRAKQGLFLFVGMLSVLFTNLVDGYHYELIHIVDRMLRSVAHRQRLLRQLEWMHQRRPVQLPRNAFEKCFALSDELEHDVEHITAPAILTHLPELDELRAEPPCQDVSSMGTQHGLRGARTGVIVPLTEAMSELNCMLAKARGVQEYWAAPAQFGYVIENVIPAAPSRRSPEVQEFIDFMARVFGEPNAHHAHKCGDASLRSALWWTNTFTQHYYQAVQHEFERPPRETYAHIVERCRDVFGGAQERPAWATSHVNGADDKAAADGWSRRSQAALVKCYAAYANEKHLGKESPTVKVTSKLTNPKDSKQPHHWAISKDWKDKEGFAALMDSDPEWYALGLDDLRAVDAEPYDFQLVDYNPVFKRQYHLAHREQEWANDWVKKLEKACIVGEIESPYAAPVIVAPKKDEHGAWTDLRYAVDYRGLNERTIRDPYPCPTADELMTRMEGASLFTATECTKAFHQRRVSDKPSGPDGLSAQQRLAFHAGNRLLTFKRMPFGHKNCVAAWQRVVDQALAGVEPMADKVEAINSLPAPKNVSDVRHFLGMATYYCRFLESFSLVAPLTALTKKDAPWKWGAAELQSFDAIKTMLVSAPVLRHPDWRRPFVMHTDWSRVGVGVCLSQVDDNGVEYAVSFASRMNTPVEADLSSYEGEVGAVVWAVQRFRYYYMYGNHFQLITECKAMEWLRTTARLRGKLARWSLIFAEYDFNIKHRPGKDNTVPDLLSRRPIPAEPVLATSDAAGTTTAIATQRRSPAAMTDASAMFGGCTPSKCLGRTPALPSARAAFATQCIAMAFTSGVYASQELHWPTRDVWSSPVAISYLRGETTPADVSVEVWQQLVRRCAKYSWHNDKVWLHTRDTAREVPKPEERPDAIRRVHASIGHLGRDRTYQVLARHFVWPGMHKDVGAMVKQCRACDHVKASFNQKHDRLKPMPLFGLFYRFSVDSAGPLPTSSEGHKYVIVIVEHFSKWIELVPVRDLEASTTAKAFHERVLARYGAPVAVVTDNGITEYQGAFREQLERRGIQPVDIPPWHPQANGMAERIVQVLKVALRKIVPTLGTASWHSWMPVIEFGYRVSKQATTGYSPYFLLFGRDHVAPDQVRALLEEPVDMDNDIAVTNLITQRADMLRAAMPKAFERALQAQQRDVVRYRKVRRGDVQPRRHRFEIGSYVYVAQPPLNTLDVRTARTILRVVEILESGWLHLSGSDGKEIQVHMDNCAPCHLSNLVPARYGRGMPACKGCGSDSIAAPRLICDKCQAMWHVACAKAELHPGEGWLCPDCAPPLRR